MLYVAWARAQIPTIPAEHPAAAGPAVQDSLRVYRHRACESCGLCAAGPVAWGRVSVTHCDSLHSRLCKCFVRLICMHYLCTAGIYVKKP